MHYWATRSIRRDGQHHPGGTIHHGAPGEGGAPTRPACGISGNGLYFFGWPPDVQVMGRMCPDCTPV